MSDSKELEKLRAYGRKIYDNAQKNIYEGMEKLNDTISMLKDFQEICTAMAYMAEGQQSQIQMIQMEHDALESEMQARKEWMARAKEKEAEYEKLQLDSAMVASLLCEMKKEKFAIEQEKAELEKEKSRFDEMKSTFIEEKNEADERAERFKREKDASIKARDEAIAEKRILEERLTAQEAEIAKKNKEIEELRQELGEIAENYTQPTEENCNVLKQMNQMNDRARWYQEYAEGLDRKVVDYFENRNEDLIVHYKNYISHSEKSPEGGVLSPQYGNAELKAVNVESGKAKEERTEAAEKQTEENTTKRRTKSSSAGIPKETEDGDGSTRDTSFAWMD